jgi:phosphoglycolate phosphatase
MIRAVLFDFDLTLAESTQGVLECANYALMRIGLPSVPEEAVRRTIGLPLQDSFRLLSGRSDSQMETDFARWFVRRADQVMAALTIVFPETTVALERLRLDGVKAAVVSTKFRYRIESILARDGLSWAFDTIVGGEDVAHPKPDPEGIQRALRAMGVEPADALYVGDHPVDARAALAAGVRFVATLTGSSAKGDFTDVPVSGFMRTLAELGSLIGDL